jgi:guanylate kinase
LNNIFGLYASTGDGKTALINAVVVSQALVGKIQIIKSTTTRPREGRDNNGSYNFVTIDEFEKMCVAGRFIETVTYGGNLYGFDYDGVDQALAHAHGICAITKNRILNLRESGYSVVPIEIIAVGNEDNKSQFYAQNPSRRNDDEAMAKIIVDSAHVIVNNFAPGGLYKATQEIVDLIIRFNKT